ncbi:integrase [Rhizobium leguminosarum]|nr:integrase [Rhizobium leguminosarum]UIL29467.1 integrase [Rhizobium leguminosarum]
MAIIDQSADPNRFLSQRNGCFTYKRRVPVIVGTRDSRAPIIRIALGTRNIIEARAKRDAYERADRELWMSLCGGGEHSAAVAHHIAATSRARALGFTYRHLTSILSEESGPAILERLRALQDAKPGSPEETAILGGVARPQVSLGEAFEFYVNKIAASELTGKSPEQRKRWYDTKKRAVTAFEEVCGQKNIGEITRDDALRFYNWWLVRIAPDPESGLKPTRVANSGNKDIGNLRVLFDRYLKHMGIRDLQNPFEKLNFTEKKKRRRRLPFSTEWITNRLFATSALTKLNAEARAIFLIVAGTGARPSEIANLPPECIILDHPVPHIKVEPREDPDDPREVKTESSIRDIPLVGVALAAMRKFPGAFRSTVTKAAPCRRLSTSTCERTDCSPAKSTPFTVSGTHLRTGRRRPSSTTRCGNC